MPVTAVLGAQWGDEGKGKIVDNLSENADVVARFQGGANAGHTINVKGKETILHQLPSGILHEKAECIMGNGMVIDPVGMVDELNYLRSEGIDTGNRIHVSLQAHVVTPLHKLLDSKSETALGKDAIGTTKRGIGPCYSDKINRSGIQIRDLKSINHVKDIINHKIDAYLQKGLLCQDEIDAITTDLETFYNCVPEVYACAADTSLLMYGYIKNGLALLIEGAQGSLLDVDFGSYPFVTSSNTTAGNIATGLGIGPTNIDRIIGVYKSYTTRVGAGPFPTEQINETGDYLQQAGGEIGATTKRKRRCGWFDATIGAYTARINGFTSIAITKLDVLDYMEEIQICTHYQSGSFPGIDLQSAVPQYIRMKGWRQDTSSARTFDNLPIEAQAYVRKIEELLDAPLEYVSVGKEREQLIHL
ncbi:adenylosuccinate synthase [bacterium]|nr:adenylosuccinate synthase [bacterium]MBU1064989.1 adenylosuccinate synthase [bacterium]MBU1634987.1 adenylosuccinate synthase [bacterium]MBU1872757.1 adenylosuccinate synthase [bacterium]